jgi:UDP-N-acetylmuramyl tripeptide synthase
MQNATTKQTSWTSRTWLAFVLGKICIVLLKLTHWLRLPWGGTAFPGRVALKVDRNIIATLRDRYQGFILVTGTNGKTSTTALIVKLLQSTGFNIVSNPEGANMVPGLLTALLKAESLGSTAANGRTRLAILEVDEGSLLPLSKLLPDVDLVVVTNLFPDQLDRYGSVIALGKRMKQAIAAWPCATLLLNADDPLVASFGHDRARTHYFAMDTAEDDPADTNLESDEVALCPICRQNLSFSSRRYAHLGSYTCGTCGFRSPPAVLIGSPLPTIEGTGSRLNIRTISGHEHAFNSTLTGLYNGYNIIAAMATTLLWRPETELSSLMPVVAAFRAPAGRTEYFSWPDQGKKGTLVLVKNPTGFNQALTTLAKAKPTTELTATTLVVAINDLPADGRDISWLWDTYISAIPEQVSIICSGRRATDVAVCFKYHGVPLDKIRIVSGVDQAVRSALTD